MINQTQAMETLSYLLGENNVPTSSVATSRKNFIQRTLEEIYRAYPWTFASVKTTLTITNGQASIPDDFDPQHKIYAYFDQGDNQYAVREINIGDSDMYEDGDNTMWLESDGDNDYILVTKDTNYSTITIKYQTLAPTISTTESTPFPDLMTLALGARRYVKLGQNPDADISQDEALFQKRLNENIAAVQVNRPLRKHRAIYKANNYRLGEV